MSIYSDTDSARNAFLEEFIDIFQVVENNDDTQTREDMYAEILEISCMIPMPKNEQPRDLSLVPISIMVIDTIGTITSQKLLKVLFDPDSTKTMISRKASPKGVLPLKMGNTQKVSTTSGIMETNEMVKLRDLKLPEFDKNRRINKQKALIFDKKYQNWVFVLIVNSLKKFKSLQKLFQRSGIQLDFFWKPLHLQKPYKNFMCEKLRHTESIWNKIIILPSHPGLKKNEQKKIIDILNRNL